MKPEIKRYRETDKPPSPTMPLPHNRTSNTRLNLRPTTPIKQEAGGKLTSLNAPRGKDAFLGSATAATLAEFIDPITKQPIIPPAGRTVPKLKIEDLATSLAPLVESQLLPEKSPMNITNKRMNKAMRAIDKKNKDLVEEKSEDAIKSPDQDMNLVNSKLSSLRRNSIGPGVNIPTPRIGSTTSAVKSAALGSNSRVPPTKKGKVGEQNVKKLMGQLREKYLDEMESQLGLAVDRRSLGALTGSSKDRGGDEPSYLSGVLPRPSTNAAEITSKIDKVVREWSYEAQQLSKNAKPSPTKIIFNPRQTATENPKKLTAAPRSLGGSGKEERLSVVLAPAPAAAKNTISLEKTGTNKNLAKISTAFKRTLDRHTAKMDVRKLINIPEDDVDQLEAEHEARRKAHEAVYNNAVTLEPSEVQVVEEKENDRNNNKIPPSSNRKNEVKALESGEQLQPNKEQPEMKGSGVRAEKADIEERKKNAINLEKLIQKKSNMTMQKPPKIPTVNSRPDPAGKDLTKYESHKKLQNLVDLFPEKIDNSKEKKPDPPAKVQKETPTTSSFDIGGTLSRSVKTIDRASSVAQRLGTLMSRVALRNEAYEREKQEKAEREKIRQLEEQTSGNITAIQMDFDANNNPSTPPAKLDSAEFGKYVDQMKIVAEKAAKSFEKFKEKAQVQDDSDLHSFSEGEDEEESDDEGNNRSNQDAYASAAAAAQVAQRQWQAEETRKREISKIQIQRQQLKNSNNNDIPKGRSLPTSTATAPPTTVTTTPASKTKQDMKNFDEGTTPREIEMVRRNALGISKSGKLDTEFKFVPDMNYTDQLMLQKLRKMKEKEGWGDSLSVKVSELMEDSDKMAGDDTSTKEEIESMIKKITSTDLTKDTERGGMGTASSLNAILRARMQSGANSNNNSSNTNSNNMSGQKRGRIIN